MIDWSFIVCGDWAPFDGLDVALLASPSEFYSDLLPILQDTDLAIVNLEGVLLDEDLPSIIKDGITIRLPTCLTVGLTAVPFQLVCLANNHSLDFGNKGLISTKKNLDRNGILSIGAGLSQDEISNPQIFSFGKTKMAIINTAEGEEGRFGNEIPGVAPVELHFLRSQISSLKTQVDIVTVIVHAGREHLPVPAIYVRDAYRGLADAGADIIIGHHPHVPQGIEKYKNSIIAYSLGNFVMGINSPIELHRLGYFIKVYFHGNEMTSFEIWPYQIERDKVRLLQDEKKDHFLKQLDELSDIIINEDSLKSIWLAYMDRWLISQGIPELLDNIVILGGLSKTLEAILKRILLFHQSPGLINRLIRSILLRCILFLENRGFTINNKSNQIMKASAILRNRFDTKAHQELYLVALKKLMDGDMGKAPIWAYQKLDEWKVF